MPAGAQERGHRVGLVLLLPSVRPPVVELGFMQTYVISVSVCCSAFVSILGRVCQAIVDESPQPRRAAHNRTQYASRTQRCTTSTPPERR